MRASGEDPRSLPTSDDDPGQRLDCSPYRRRHHPHENPPRDAKLEDVRSQGLMITSTRQPAHADPYQSGVNGLLDVSRKTYSECTKDVMRYVEELGGSFDALS